eukprot:1503643-Amphidinium_carterae.1
MPQLCLTGQVPQQETTMTSCCMKFGWCPRDARTHFSVHGLWHLDSEFWQTPEEGTRGQAPFNKCQAQGPNVCMATRALIRASSSGSGGKSEPKPAKMPSMEWRRHKHLHYKAVGFLDTMRHICVHRTAVDRRKRHDSSSGYEKEGAKKLDQNVANVEFVQPGVPIISPCTRLVPSAGGQGRLLAASASAAAGGKDASCFVHCVVLVLVPVALKIGHLASMGVYLLNRSGQRSHVPSLQLMKGLQRAKDAASAKGGTRRTLVKRINGSVNAVNMTQTFGELASRPSI